jgi:hypothetical protein
MAYDVPVEFKSYGLNSDQAKSIWGDKIGASEGDDDPAIGVVTGVVDTKEGRFVVSMLLDNFYCGNTTCPVRVFEGDKVVYDRSVCSNIAMIVLRPDARKLVACDKVVDLDPR